VRPPRRATREGLGEKLAGALGALTGVEIAL
jgi:hypothetical protein